jgi:hypothetical protein
MLTDLGRKMDEYRENYNRLGTIKKKKTEEYNNCQSELKI